VLKGKPDLEILRSADFDAKNDLAEGGFKGEAEVGRGVVRVYVEILGEGGCCGL